MGRSGPLTSQQGTVRLRPAAEADAELLMAWRNDPDTVHFSRSARTVSRSKHRLWLRERLADESSRIWIGEEAERPIGQVRVDHRDDAWIVAIVVSPPDRGRGLAAKMLRCLQLEMIGYSDAGTLLAEVHRDNVASKRAFVSVGFRLQAEADGFASFAWRWTRGD